jgi:hypothetical protein
MSMILFALDLEIFQARRRASQDEAIEALRAAVRDALENFGAPAWDTEVLLIAGQVWDATQEADGGSVEAPLGFFEALSDSLNETTTPTDPPSDAQVERVATWIAVYTINASTDALAVAAQLEEDDLVLREWVTMQDADVRDLHRPLNGVQRPIGERFQVGVAELRWPGDPVGPPEGWINCRCVLRPTLGGEMAAKTVTAASDPVPDTVEPPELTEDEQIDMLMHQADFDPGTIPIHGVLLDRTEETGDRRHLAGEFSVLSVIDGPVPLRWVKSDVGMHDGAVRVASITETWQEGDRILFNGNMVQTPEAAEVLALLAEGRMGISVDMDSAVFEFEGDEGEEMQVFTEGRIRGATLVDIPALVGAWAEMGSWQDIEMLAASGCAPCQEQQEIYRTFQISDAEWDGSSSRFTDEEWCRSTIVHLEEGCTSKSEHKMPIREPGGALNRNAVHNAAARFNQVEAPEAEISAARSRLRAAYSELGEEPPEIIASSATGTFQVPGIPPQTKDAPGWITHPSETARLRRYWTEGAGAAKISWGAPGDFNRCRTQLAKYVMRPDWLAGLCANMHFDALGFWPGEHRLRTVEGAVMASAFTVVDERKTLPAAWFENPHLKMPTPVTVTQEGRVFGHIAQWGVCHTGLGLSVGDADACVAAPPSASGYAYFLTGVIDTDAGEVPVGSLTMGTGHAGERLGSHPAAAHYDNTGFAIADVTVGEDEHGIWFSGAMRPDIDEDRLREFKAATLSGDWRKVRGDYEMVAALAVNVPGFPIPRLALAASAGRQISLIAAGVVPPRTDDDAPTITPLEFVKEVRTIEARAAKAAALKQKFAAERAEIMKARRQALVKSMEG